MTETPKRLKIAVAVASTGRATVLAQTVPTMLDQTRPPDRLVVMGAADEDVFGLKHIDPRVEIGVAPKGASRQRNACLDHLAGAADVVVFFDDDYVPYRDYMEMIEAIFMSDPLIVGLTGHVTRDGVNEGGISFETAQALRDADWASVRRSGFRAPWDVSHLYGCNMAARLPQASLVRFDERLPLYSWQEDRDFSARLRAHGRVVRTDSLLGVHMGVTRGRSPGLRLGYSQVANPLYLLAKGSMRPMETVALIGRNVAANLLKAATPEPWVDRAGRLRGNLLALGDAIVGRADPERILTL